jgi:VDE lipocalin domain
VAAAIELVDTLRVAAHCRLTAAAAPAIFLKPFNPCLAGLLYGKINWRVPKADGDFLQRGVVQTFRQQDEKDILLNHGSASLHLAAGSIRTGRNVLAKGQQRSTPTFWHTAGYVANCSPSCGN